MTEPCRLIGILDDGWAGLSEAARARLAAAELVIGAGRTLALVAAHLVPGCEQLAMDGALSRLPDQVRAARAEGRRVVVLATGDPLCHGIGGRLSAELGTGALEILPTTSTLQLAFARLQRPWQDAHVTSCHGGPVDDWRPDAGPGHGLDPVLRAVARHPLVAVFTSPHNGPDRIARALLTAGHGEDLRLSVAARLACADEAVFARLTLAEAAGQCFPAPNIVIIEAETAPVGVADEGARFGLPDRSFAQQAGAAARDSAGQADGGLITKLEARAVSLAKLGLRADSIVWDIGAGSGAVGLEASRIAHRGQVWAIEKHPARAADARANAHRLRASNYYLSEGRAPAGLETWPDPDAIFIGGSGGTLDGPAASGSPNPAPAGLLAVALARLRPGGRLVMNLIALEHLATATAALERAGQAWELIQLGVARSQPILDLHRLAALNPVWILTTTKDPMHD